MQKHQIELEQTNEGYVARVGGIDGCEAAGETIAEVLQAIAEQLEDRLACAPEAEAGDVNVRDDDEPPLRPLPVDLDELVEIASFHNPGYGDLGESYLDLQTGEILRTGGEFDPYDDDDDDEDGEGRESDFEDEESAVRAEPDRFAVIPEIETQESYRLMERFVAAVKERSVREKLQIAIAGQGAFRRFKDVVHRYPLVSQQWYAFQERAQREWAAEWLQGLGIRTTWRPPGKER